MLNPNSTKFKCHESNQRMYADSLLLFSRSLVGDLLSFYRSDWLAKQAAQSILCAGVSCSEQFGEQLSGGKESLLWHLARSHALAGALSPLGPRSPVFSYSLFGAKSFCRLPVMTHSLRPHSKQSFCRYALLFSEQGLT